METQDDIDATIEAFFRAFDNRHGPPAIALLRRVMLPDAVITRVTGDGTTTMSLDGFIAPRHALLTNGSLSDFHEWELQGHTERLGQTAARMSRYEKAGLMAGAPYAGTGCKTFMLRRTAKGWRIASLAWSDDE